MKITKLILSLALLSSASAYAEAPKMYCTVKAPCAFSKPSRLGYCLAGGFPIRRESDGGHRYQMTAVVGRSVLNESHKIAAFIPVIDTLYRRIMTVKNLDTESTDLFSVTQKSVDSDRYSGFLVLDRKYRFAVSCKAEDNSTDIQ